MRAGRELRGLVRDALQSGAWQGAVSAADLAQIALVAHVLGLSEYGRLALAAAFVTLVVRIFDLRVAAVVVSFAARTARDDMRATAGVFQLGYAVDAATGLVAFGVIAALAPLAGEPLVGEGGTLLVLLYGLVLLAGTLDESSLSVLRLLDRFGVVAATGVALELLRVALVAVAVVAGGELVWVLAALAAYQATASAVRLAAAERAFRRASNGRSLARPALGAVRGEVRAMLRMLGHTNAVSYARLAQTQLPTLVVGALAGPAAAGVYKVGTAAGAALGRLADPLSLATLPRLARLYAAQRSGEIRRLLRSSTALAATVMGAGALAAVLLREEIAGALGGPDAAAAAGTVLVLAAAAYAVNGSLFWNTPLLYAAHRPAAMTGVALAGLAVQVASLLALVPPYGAAGAAGALLASVLVTNAAASALALTTVGVRVPLLPRPGEPVLDNVR